MNMVEATSTREERGAEINELFEQIRASAKICSEQCPPRKSYICWCGYRLYSGAGFDRHLEVHVRHRDYDIPEMINGSSLSHPWTFQNTKKLVYKRDMGICRSCGDKLDGSYEVHHIKPRSSGGSDHPANLILICQRCHNVMRIASKR